MTTLFRRSCASKTLTIAASGNLSDAIDFRHKAMLVVHMPGTWTAASIGFKISSTEDGTYQPLYDDDGNLVQIDSPTASNTYSAPASLAGALWVKLWSQNGSGTNTAQAAARSLIVDAKA